QFYQPSFDRHGQIAAGCAQNHRGKALGLRPVLTHLGITELLLQRTIKLSMFPFFHKQDDVFVSPKPRALNISENRRATFFGRIFAPEFVSSMPSNDAPAVPLS